jgi:hypothetical protein
MTKCDKCKDPEYLATLEELCEHDPETQRQQMETAKFYKVYPEIIGLAYSAAEVLRREKNLNIREPAIATVATEIKRRANIDSPAYSISRRRVTADQVREILNEARITAEGTHLQREKLLKKQAQKEIEAKDVQYTCPLCQGLITVQLSKRDKIVSLRATPEADDAYAYLAKRFDVSRSFLLSELLAIQSKFPNLFKE